MREVLIGTGFYASAKNHEAANEFYNHWRENTLAASPSKVVIVDNSEQGCGETDFQIVRINNNLGHVSDPIARRSQFNGWSMSWIIPAMIAYSEDCDFVYKEQDCLAFGNWLPQIRRGRAAFGNHHAMDCEQSLFFIERDFIPTFVQVYLSLPRPDMEMVPETKFAIVEGMLKGFVERFDMGVGRTRPLPADLHVRPWYAQKFEFDEMDRLRREGLLG